MSAPRVSILLPVWNAAATLPACLASISRQRLRDWECIAVDDGSTDETGAILARATAADDRIRVVSIAHGGLVAALDAGLRRCRAPLVARMDADDVMHRERLEAQAAALEADAALDAVGCHVRIFPRARLQDGLREYERWLNGMDTPAAIARDAYIECPVAHPTLMMRRAMASLGYADRGWPEDYDLVLRALGTGMRIGIVPRRFHAWRDRPGRLSRTDERYSLEAFTACKAHYLASGFLSQVERYVLWGYGGTGRALRRALAAHGRTPSHIVEVKRSRLGNRIHGAAVIPPLALHVIRGVPIVASVARPGPRGEVRRALEAMGFCEGRDFVCAA